MKPNLPLMTLAIVIVPAVVVGVLAMQARRDRAAKDEAFSVEVAKEIARIGVLDVIALSKECEQPASLVTWKACASFSSKLETYQDRKAKAEFDRCVDAIGKKRCSRLYDAESLCDSLPGCSARL